MVLPCFKSNIRWKKLNKILTSREVVISTVTFIISTAEELQKDEKGRVDFPRIVLVIDLIDNFVVIFFTLEYLVRLLVCPNKKR